MTDVEQGKICAILAWFFPIGLIWFFVDENMKKNKFAEFHVKQSLVLAIVAIIINVVGTIIPVLGWFIILPIGNLLVFVFFIIGLIKAIQGEEKELPIIGKFGEKFKF
ncbi:MAG: DUF4870 domain-containing protein [Nanoarchaeota archaeon]|nr:DUF4870 domain-containing protein [Nanoarchaeota archaeon]MCK5630512.1 DUF4870 domain-containing protein [Nanoarchaeota archaeon]